VKRAWRIVLVSTVAPVVGALTAKLRELGHEPVAVVSARRRPDARPNPVAITPETAPDRLDVLFARNKWSLEPLLRAGRPDLVLCWAFPWKLPPEALDVALLGAVNMHPALLPRHRGPVPLAWALRDGDADFGVTWHRMDADFDTGAILAQARVPIEDDDCTIEEVGPKLLGAALSLLPTVLERVATGDPGDPQPSEGATWAAAFGEDYAAVDWSQPARRIHDQVRAWTFTFGQSGIVAPVAELEGRRVVLRRTSLVERPDAIRVECGDRPIWIVAHDSAPEEEAGSSARTTPAPAPRA
jgi:methionyl-tRNA formyltransferase